MAITITVETGAVVTGANSFVSLSDFKTYCDNRGRVYSAVYVDETIKAALIKMADYLNDLPWYGVKTARANPMSWPRYGLEEGGASWNELEYPSTYWTGVLDRDGNYILPSEVPTEVIKAQNEGAWLILTGKDMEPNLDRGGQLKMEKYDVIQFEYFSGASPTTEFKAVTNRLRGLLKCSNTMPVMRG
jgi:hypothetical protein